MNNNTSAFIFISKIAFGMTVLFSALQLFLFKFGNVPVPLFYLLSLLITPLALIQIKCVKWKPISWFVVLISVQILSLTWSSDIVLGIKQILTQLMFLSILLSTIYILKNDFAYFKKVISLLYLIVFFIGVLVIVFRLSPNTEMAFLKSQIASIFINPNSLQALFGDSPNNIFDVSKSGGIFINANTASAYFGIAGLSGVFLSRVFCSRIILLIALFCLVCVCFTGSKAAVLILALFVFIYCLNTTLGKLFIPVLILSGGVAIYALYDLIFDFQEQVLETAFVRILIWQHFSDNFIPNLFTGQGFGGWAESFSKYAYTKGITAAFPPHNTFINLWSESGLMALIPLILFYYSLVKSWLTLKIRENVQANRVGSMLICTVSWLVIHGMGENFGAIGDDHIMAIFAFNIALAYHFTRVYK